MMTDGPCRLFWWLGAILTEAGKWFNAQTTTVSRIIIRKSISKKILENLIILRILNIHNHCENAY